VSISDKTDDIQPNRRRSEADLPPVLRRGREHRIVRWIGAANRRTPKRAEELVAEAPAPRVITLSWAETFGRPDRSGPTRFGRPVSTDAQVLPFQTPAGRTAPQPAPRRAADQPPVPVLR
jgi:hypothetical protein